MSDGLQVCPFTTSFLGILVNRPSLLQVAIRSSSPHGKNVLLFDLQELFNRSKVHHESSSIVIDLLRSLFNHSKAEKLSQSFFYDLAQLKCSYDEDCFQTAKLEHLIELSRIYRRVYSDQKAQEIYSLQRMTAVTLHFQLDKRQQCANWSKRPLSPMLKDYAAMDVIVMIDIYDRLRKKFEDERAVVDSSSSWLVQDDQRETLIIDFACSFFSRESFRQSIETAIDLTALVLYACVCQQRFMTTKTRNKHTRTCPEHLGSLPHSQSIDATMIAPTVIPCGRGYLPPALRLAYQSINQQSFCEQVRSSSAFNRWNQYSKNRPPDAQFFLDDHDTEVAQAFGLQSTEMSSSASLPTISQRVSLPSITTRVKPKMKIASYPPKNHSLGSPKLLEAAEKVLLDRLKDDFDSQPEFHCHLFGLGGRGRSLSTDQSPASPSFSRQGSSKCRR